jgi:hypothetical protein
MSLNDPQDIRIGFWSVIERLQKADAPISQTEQKRIAEELSLVYNYVAQQVEGRGAANLLYAQSARDAKMREQLALERKVLEQHKTFVEVNFEGAEKHFKAVQLAGYAVYFATWGFTRQWASPFFEVIGALLMIFSASIFVLWELLKTSILASILKRNAKISESGLDAFLATRHSQFSSTNRAISFFSRSRVWVWRFCVIPAVLALGFLVASLITHLAAL